MESSLFTSSKNSKESGITKMKIAILTQPLHTNFGGTLQNFALQRVLKEMGHTVETIDYDWGQASDLKKILSFCKNYFLGKKPNLFFFNSELDYISKKHNLFISHNIFLSNKILDTSTLVNYFEEKKFDAVIVGSDQVWRVAYSPKIENFFLDFLIGNKEIKKIAYAASFGLDEWQFSAEDTFYIKNLIKEFNYISVREDTAVTLCKNFLDLDVEHVLDPTLLLKKDEYIKLFDCTKFSRGGIFSYILDNNEDKIEKIDLLCKTLDKKSFICMPKKTKKEKIFINNREDYVYPNIEEWIGSFYKADYVITDSFHGTVFSIIFNKPFIAISNNERGATRFKSLLNFFNLEDRLVDAKDEIDVSMIFKPINYEFINDKISGLKRTNMKKIQKILES